MMEAAGNSETSVNVCHTRRNISQGDCFRSPPWEPWTSLRMYILSFVCHTTRRNLPQGDCLRSPPWEPWTSPRMYILSFVCDTTRRNLPQGDCLWSPPWEPCISPRMYILSFLHLTSHYFIIHLIIPHNFKWCKEQTRRIWCGGC